jgi:hypothetical protein
MPSLHPESARIAAAWYFVVRAREEPHAQDRASGVDLCPDALYLRVTGKSPEEKFPALQHELAHA